MDSSLLLDSWSRNIECGPTWTDIRRLGKVYATLVANQELEQCGSEAYAGSHMERAREKVANKLYDFSTREIVEAFESVIKAEAKNERVSQHSNN